MEKENQYLFRMLFQHSRLSVVEKYCVEDFFIYSYLVYIFFSNLKGGSFLSSFENVLTIAFKIKLEGERNRCCIFVALLKNGGKIF